VNERIKISLVIVITAAVVGGGAYYLWEDKKLEAVNSGKENVTYARSSKEYAVMGRMTWSAFECSALASKIEDSVEAERLFLFGYEQGKEFLGALKAEKIKQEDISQEVPIGITMLLQGPSEEFILGRIHSFAEEEALDEVFKTGNEYNSDELQDVIARNEFQNSNCQLIGK